MDKEQIRKALDHFEDDQYTDAKEILTQEIRTSKEAFLTDKLGIQEFGHDKKKENGDDDDDDDNDKKKKKEKEMEESLLKLQELGLSEDDLAELSKKMKKAAAEKYGAGGTKDKKMGKKDKAASAKYGI